MVQFLLHRVQKAVPALLELGIIASPPPPSFAPSSAKSRAEGTPALEVLRDALDKQARVLLPELVGLTDAFGFSDWELDSIVSSSFTRTFLSFQQGTDRRSLYRSLVTVPFTNACSQRRKLMRSSTSAKRRIRNACTANTSSQSCSAVGASMLARARTVRDCEGREGGAEPQQLRVNS